MRAWLVVLVLLGDVAVSTPAEACSCSRPAKPCAWVFSGTSFVGRVVGTAKQSPSTAITTFEVIETLFSALPLTKHVDVTHGTDEAACGMSFDRGAPMSSTRVAQAPCRARSRRACARPPIA